MGKLPFEKERKLQVRYEEPTNPDFGCLPHKRTIKDHLLYGKNSEKSKSLCYNW